jgi:murein L,D-transpeptidase YcbB/YkuD
VTKLVKAPQQVKVPVAAEYAVVNKQVMVAPERAEWTQVLCVENSSPEKIQEVKRALNSQGASLRVDGEIDDQLTNSVRSFQEQNGLRADGLMTAETLAKLGVELN